MKYRVIGQSGRVEKGFLKVIHSLSEEEQEKVWQILLDTPKGTASTHWTIKKVHKDIWQLDLPHGFRLEYTVLDKEQAVIVLFTGSHDDAAAYLRGKK